MRIWKTCAPKYAKHHHSFTKVTINFWPNVAANSQAWDFIEGDVYLARYKSIFDSRLRSITQQGDPLFVDTTALCFINHYSDIDEVHKATREKTRSRRRETRASHRSEKTADFRFS